MKNFREPPTRTWTTRLLSVALTAAVVGMTSCTVIYNDKAEQCSTNADCQAKGPDFAKAICNADHICANLGAVIGAGCKVDLDCQSFQCSGELCTKTCNSPGDCTAPATCTSRRLCEIPLSAGFVYSGVPQDEGWTFSHEVGRQATIAALPYFESNFVQLVFTPEGVEKSAKEFLVDKNYDILIGTSSGDRKSMLGVAQKYPDKKILLFNGPGNTKYDQPNVYAKFFRMEQAYYLAGLAAGRLSKTKRLGFVGGFITPQVVRHANAFLRGARSVDPTIVMEFKWIGFFFDFEPANSEGFFRETVFANDMLAAGADVIAHNTDTGRSVEAVETARKAGKNVYSIAYHNGDGCNRGPTGCIGAAHWNWGPSYIKAFEAIHKGQFKPGLERENIQTNAVDSGINFKVNSAVAGNDTELIVNEKLAKLVTDPQFSLKGPYCANGDQRSPKCLGPDEAVSDEELETMCWFMEGIVAKVDPKDPLSADAPALVPAECKDNQ